jgi:hypothetical protein
MAEPLSETGKNSITRGEFLKIVHDLRVANTDIRERTKELAAARGVKAGILRRAKSQGADKDALKLYFELADMDDDGRTQLLDTTAGYAAWTGLSMWTPGVEEDAEQDELFPEQTAEAKLAIRKAAINSDGRNAAMVDGSVDDNPHHQGSEDHQIWRAGFDDFKAGRPPQQFIKVPETAGAEKTKTASAAKRPRKPASSKTTKSTKKKPAKEVAAVKRPRKGASGLEPPTSSIN